MCEHEVSGIPGAKLETLVSCERYTVVKADICGEAKLDFDKPFVDVSVLEGEGSIGGLPVKKGTHAIVPAGYGELKLEGNMMLICSFPPQE